MHWCVLHGAYAGCSASNLPAIENGVWTAQPLEVFSPGQEAAASCFAGDFSVTVECQAGGFWGLAGVCPPAGQSHRSID